MEVLSLLLDAGANVYKTDGGDHRDEGSEGSLKKDVNKRIDKMKAKVSRDVEKVKKIAHEVKDKVMKTATDIGTGIHEAAEKVNNKIKKDAGQFAAKAKKANNKIKNGVGKLYRQLRPNTFLEMKGVENPDSNVLMYHAKFEKNSAAQQELDAIIKKNTAEEGIAQYPHIHAVLQSLSGETSFLFLLIDGSDIFFDE